MVPPAPYLVSFLYVILCGLVAASPSCCWRHSSYSEKLRERRPRVVGAMETTHPHLRWHSPTLVSPRRSLRTPARAVPAKDVTLLSSSNARMWVATPSRNQRSWEMTMAQSAN